MKPLIWALSAAAAATLLFLGIWGPFSDLLHESHRVEIQRLVEAFEGPLAEAIAKGDDLGKIDQLRRLQKCSGVVTATVDTDTQKNSHDGTPLVWDGKTVGWLNIRLSRAHWLRYRYGGVERMWTLVVLMGVMGGLLGWIIQRRMSRHLIRLERLLERNRRRQRGRLAREKRSIEAEWLACTRQAMMFAPNALVLLDERQAVVAWNPPAQEWFPLSADIQGKHWLDLKKSPEWAAALQSSVDHPGIPIPGPSCEGPSGLSLLSVAPGATWIILKTTASQPAVAIV